jgi:hypothetical protein
MRRGHQDAAAIFRKTGDRHEYLLAKKLTTHLPAREL